MYKKILVVANPYSEEQPALARAVDIAKREPISKITLFVTIYDFSYEMTPMLDSDERHAMRAGMLKQKRKWLHKICQPYLDDGFSIEIEAKWYNRPFEAILKYAQANHYELIIKATHKHDKLEAMIFTPTDWHLIRKSASPLLLVKDKPFPEKANIIAAVDLLSENEGNEAFNEKIVREAQKVARLLDGNVYVANAYPSTPASIAVELPEFDPIEYTKAIKAHHLSEMRTLKDKCGLSDEQTIIEEGLAEKVIPRLAEKLDAKLVVMGTQGRTGISAAFIGNTAESIIDRLECDLLALKPDSYVSLYKEE